MLCSLSELPRSLTELGYVSPLGGNTLDMSFESGIRVLDSGTNVAFTLTEKSLVTVYVETPEDIPVVVSIQETGGLRKSTVLSTD
jgi:hypothetical protein